MSTITLFAVLLVVNTRAVYGDPCASRPCLNSGICTSSNGITFKCKCGKSFFGERCEVWNDACERHACQNGGSCRADVHGDYHCECPAGYRGIFCEIDHDDCLPSPCRNSASCVDKVDDYECVCLTPGTFGKKCEFRESDLKEFSRDCPDGSVCWRHYTKTLTIPWGYGDNICSTHHSCFGKPDESRIGVEEHVDYFIDVQLHPVQMQLGDVLNFTSDNSIQAAVNGFMPRLIPVDVYNDSVSFVNCNTTNGTLLVTTPQHNIMVNDTKLLHVGIHYFIMNIDFTYRCDFGLRLNISVKEHDCQQREMTMLCSNKGQCHTHFGLAQYQCRCGGGYRGKYCEMRDHCFDNPCRNEGQCINNENHLGGMNYTCLCRPGYSGKHCSIVIDMCTSHPCKNDAICHSHVNSYSCQCKTGYTGFDCSININECSTFEPCENNGTCVDSVGDYSCVCPNGFTGSNCEVNIDECASNPCKKGVCIDGINSYHCSCHALFTGVDCNSSLSECSSHPCLNGGVCIDKGTDYHCQCGLGYEGKNCERDVDLCSKPEACINFHSCVDKGTHALCTCKSGFTGANCGVNINECESQPCKFGGKCQDKENGFTCLCLPGYEGDICDKVNKTFHDPSRLHLKLATKDCFRLKSDPRVLEELRRGVASSIRSSCKCPFSEDHIFNNSITLNCHDRVTGSLYLRLSGIQDYTTEQLICYHHHFLSTHNSGFPLGNNTEELEVVYNKDRCARINALRNQISDTSNGGTVALTIGLVVSLLLLFAASVVVFLKWRKKAGRPARKKNSDLAPAINLDVLSTTVPTPKSMYGTKRGARRNYGYTSYNFDPVQLKSKQV